MSVKSQILAVMKNEDRPISPKEIAKIGRLKPGSVRAYLSMMYKNGEVHKEFYGHYIIAPTYGVGTDEPIYVQNLTFVAEGVNLKSLTEGIIRAVGFDYLPNEGWVKAYQHIDQDNEHFQIRTQLGLKRGKVTWTVAAPKGLGYYGLVCCKHIVEDNLSRLGIVFSDFGTQFESKNVELLQDYMGINIAGMKGVTLTNFYGQMEKIYNKIYGVRHEVRDSQANPLNNIMATMRGGMDYSQVITGVGMISKDTAKTNDNIKALIGVIMDFTQQFGKSMNMLQESHYKLVDTVDTLKRNKEESG